MPTEDEWADADALAEDLHQEFTGKPAAKPAAQGLADMEKQLARLRRLRQQAEKCPGDAQERLHSVDREIADVQARIRAYKLQFEGRN